MLMAATAGAKPQLSDAGGIAAEHFTVDGLQHQGKNRVSGAGALRLRAVHHRLGRLSLHGWALPGGGALAPPGRRCEVVLAWAKAALVVRLELGLAGPATKSFLRGCCSTKFSRA